jgi:hypothetical protein
MTPRCTKLCRYRGWLLFGDIHGTPLQEVKDLRGCGPTTVRELLALVTSKGGRLATPDVFGVRGLEIPQEPTLRVTPAATGLDPFSLPLPIRVEKTLRNMGIQRLGELDGKQVDQLLVQRQFGTKSLAQLREIIKKANEGFYGFPGKKGAICDPANLLIYVDAAIAKMPAAMQSILRLRHADKPRTLEEVGARCGRITKQRVWQQLEKAYRLLRHGGPRFPRAMASLAQRFNRQHPLTADRLRILSLPWVFKEAPAFYASLLDDLHPGLGPSRRAPPPEKFRPPGRNVKNCAGQRSPRRWGWGNPLKKRALPGR